MTIFDYLDTIGVDASQDVSADNPVIPWFTYAPTPEEVGYNPYVVVEEGEETPIMSFYEQGNDVTTPMLTVAILQEPDETGRTPNRTPLINIFNKVMQATKFVDRDSTEGLFVDMALHSAIRPQTNPQTKGLMAVVRFRILAQRQ